jgi:hypothetical protein
LMQGTTLYHLGMYIWPSLPCSRKWISEINQPDTDKQQLYTNLWLNRTLYTPKNRSQRTKCTNKCDHRTNCNAVLTELGPVV